MMKVLPVKVTKILMNIMIMVAPRVLGFHLE
jgi:hypothetical protein